MSKISRADALEDISSWTSSDVIAFLTKNGLDETCCRAVAKRQIDGDEFLHLTEGKLALWKSDLTRPLIWSLRTFVENVRKYPEKFVEEKKEHQVQQLNDDALSDSGSWGSDFDDDIDQPDEIDMKSEDTRSVIVPKNNNFHNHLRIFQENDKAAQTMMESRGIRLSTRQNHRSSVEPIENTAEEITYANCDINASESEKEVENTYVNVGILGSELKNGDMLNISMQQKNVSTLWSNTNKSLAEQLREQLMLQNNNTPVVNSNAEKMSFDKNRTEEKKEKHEPRSSFLHKQSRSRVNGGHVTQKKMTVPPPPEPKKSTTSQQQCTNSSIEETMKSLPKPPTMLRNFDLVANLPMRAEESEDEYESFDEQIIEQHQRNGVARVDSRQSLTSGPQSSVESVYQPPSINSREEEEVYEIYESITETIEESNVKKTDFNARIPVAPPPLPSKLPSPSSERSPDKKSATLPHAGSNSSLASERAARPLPPPPDTESYIDKPWFHNVTRERATCLIKEPSTYGNIQNGYFLLRPSTTNPNNPLALVLWCNGRVYNVPVRKRPDKRYALGSPKKNEQTFHDVEEIVTFYKREELVLYTGGVESGSTRLTDSPPK